MKLTVTTSSTSQLPEANERQYWLWYLPVLLMSGLSLGTVQCNTPTAGREQNHIQRFSFSSQHLINLQERQNMKFECFVLILMSFQIEAERSRTISRDHVTRTSG